MEPQPLAHEQKKSIAAMKRLAVIILNWNGIGLLKRFLPQAAADTIDGDTDLIVADNGSEDGSAEWVERNCPEVKVIRFAENYGFAGGYNRAVEATRYEYTLLLNSDVETTPGWIRPLLAFMDSNPQAGACQPKILSWHHRDTFEYAGAAGGYIDRNGYPYCRGRIFTDIEKDLGQYDGEPALVAWVSGAAMMARTAFYIEAGGLDTDFFAHQEEIDLCLRMAGLGHPVYAVPDSKVYHIGGASLAHGNPKKTYLNFRNNLLLLHKNLPRRVSRPLLIRRRLLDTLAFGMYCAKLDFRNAAAILRAHRDFRRMRPGYTSLPDRDYLSSLPGSRRDILKEHYLHLKPKK